MKRCVTYLRLMLIAASLLSPGVVAGQAKVRKLSTIINHPSLNLYAPYMSADANAVIFLSDNAEDHALTPFFSYREGADWKEPQVLPKLINTRLNFLRGYALNADGSRLFFSTLKSPGVGGFDICTSEWRGGNAWGNPENLGAPINSRQHEACPSLTPDGKTLYFMRCGRMDQNAASACTLFRVDKKPNGTWGDPVELPAHINTGNSQTPRIMADGETLIFASDKMPGSKGGMDLYISRFANGAWSQPVPMGFANTAEDDQYVSISALGRYLLRDAAGSRKRELVEYLIPDHLRPKGMMKIEGKVVNASGTPVPAYISLVNTETGERVYNGRPAADGTFLLYAMEGAHYELGVDPEHGNRTYFTKTFDLTADPIPQVEKVHAVLTDVDAGAEWVLAGVSFENDSTVVDIASSQRELQRFGRLVTANPDLHFELEVIFTGYLEDSIRSDESMTEVRFDTLHWLYIDIDTLGQLFERDTVSVKAVYHNDRTQQQADAIVAYMDARGTGEGRVIGRGTAIPAILPEDRKTIVRVRAVSR